MTTFDNRERGYENKFAHDNEMEFNIIARRNKLLGLWSAEKMEMSEENATNYAIGLVEKTAMKNSSGCVLTQILEDFDTAEVTIQKAEVEAEMESLLKKARDQVITGKGA